jgi:hypothetical protein
MRAVYVVMATSTLEHSTAIAVVHCKLSGVFLQLT